MHGCDASMLLLIWFMDISISLRLQRDLFELEPEVCRRPTLTASSDQSSPLLYVDRACLISAIASNNLSRR